MNIEPRIIERPAFRVAGMRIHTRAMAGDIPALWQAFAPRIDEVPAIAEPRVSYGIMDNFDAARGTLDYMAAVSVSGTTAPPDGMTEMTLAAQTYAVFEATLGTLGEVFGFIFNTWPKHSRFQQIPAPYFERYGESFDPGDRGSVVEIYIPVRARAQ